MDIAHGPHPATSTDIYIDITVHQWTSLPDLTSRHVRAQIEGINERMEMKWSTRLVMAKVALR